MELPRSDVQEVARAFHLLAGYNGIVRWAARRGDEIEGAWAASALELAQFAEAYTDWDFYVQLNPSDRKHGKRCRAEDIAAWEWFVVDLDPEAGYLPSVDELRIAANEIEHALHAYTGKDYVAQRVFSGRGMQLWFRVGALGRTRDGLPMHPWSLGGNAEHIIHETDIWAPEDMVKEKRRVPLRDAIACAQRYWLSQLAGRVTNKRIIVDPSVSDLPRLMRCPGTFNRKTGVMAFFAGGLSSVQEHLGYKLLKYTPTDRLLPAPKPGELLPDGAPWQAALSKINATAAGTITYGATEPGRHRAMSGAARALAEVGLSEGEILKALTVAGERSRPELLDGEYLARTARDAVVRFARISVDARP